MSVDNETYIDMRLRNLHIKHRRRWYVTSNIHVGVHLQYNTHTGLFCLVCPVVFIFWFPCRCMWLWFHSLQGWFTGTECQWSNHFRISVILTSTKMQLNTTKRGSYVYFERLTLYRMVCHIHLSFKVVGLTVFHNSYDFALCGPSCQRLHYRGKLYAMVL